MMDVVERIDALAAEEKCPHCDRQWHELPLTLQIVRMFESGRLNSDYFTREDKSRIVCDGSSFIGPLRPEPEYASGGIIAAAIATDWPALTWPTFDFAPLVAQMKDIAAQFASMTATFTLWLPGETEPEPLDCEPAADIVLEFGPQNWIPPQEPVGVPAKFATAVLSRWSQFAKEDIPAPASPGYDFSRYDWEPKYPIGKKGKK